MGQKEEEDVEERRKEGRKQQLKKQKEAKTPGPRSWASRASGVGSGPLRAQQPAGRTCGPTRPPQCLTLSWPWRPRQLHAATSSQTPRGPVCWEAVGMGLVGGRHDLMSLERRLWLPLCLAGGMFLRAVLTRPPWPRPPLPGQHQASHPLHRIC